MTKRLFLFAGYNKDGIIDDSLVFYVYALSKIGDVVLVMDSTCANSELIKLNPYVLHVAATRHGEYDFGSYKRAYIWARDNLDMGQYDCIYLVNDSVFGPLFDINKTICDIENIKTDAAGMVVTTHTTHSYMESWFIRLNKNIFTKTWFDKFITSVRTQPTKQLICIKYEHGLTNLIAQNGCTWGGLFTYRGRFTYNNPKKMFRSGCPFIKKASFIRHNGALGAQIKYILAHCDKNAARVIIKTASTLYGTDYMHWFLTGNPFKIMMRNIKYGIYKIKNGGI